MSRSRTIRSGPSPLEVAKERLDIPELARRCGWEWRPGKSCAIPWREDRSPSGSVFADGRLLRDFSSGETYDAPAVLAQMTGLSVADACREFIRIAGVGTAEVTSLPVRRRAPRPQPPPRKPTLPRLEAPGKSDLGELATLRGLDVVGLAEAARRGLLWFGGFRGARCWFLTDSSGWVAQARRLDGQKFERENGATFKAYTLSGSRAGWPVGVAEAVKRPRVVLCEGGPDLLAAFCLARRCGCLDEIGVVSMLGAGCRIVEDALPLFAGVRVRIFHHADLPRPDQKSPGLEGALRWQEQLDSAGARVGAYDLSGLVAPDLQPVKDLNDVAREWEHLTRIEPELRGAFDF